MKRVNKTLSVLISVMLVWSTPSQAGFSCGDLLARLQIFKAKTLEVEAHVPKTIENSSQAEIPAASDSSNNFFDYQLFLSYRDALKSGQQLTLDDGNPPPELILAAIDSTNPDQSTMGKYIEQVLQSGDEKENSKLFKFISRFDLENGLYEGRIKGLLTTLYRLANSKDGGFSNWFRPNKFSEQLIKKKVETEIATKDFMTAMSDLGFLENNSRSREIIDSIRQNSKWIDLGVTTAMDALAFFYLRLPPFPPPTKISDLKPVPEKVANLVREKGFDASYAEIKPYFKNTARFDYAWGLARKAFIGINILIMSHILYNQYPLFKLSIGMALTSRHEVVQMQNKNFNADTARKQQLNSYAQFIKDTFDRPATPDELHRKWMELKAQPNESFRLKD